MPQEFHGSLEINAGVVDKKSDKALYE